MLKYKIKLVQDYWPYNTITIEFASDTHLSAEDQWRIGLRHLEVFNASEWKLEYAIPNQKV